MSLVNGSNSAFNSSIFFFLILIFKVKAFLCCRLKFLPIELFQLLHSVLIDWVDHVKDFKALLAQSLEEGR